MWIHKKTGGKYRILSSDAKMECSTEPRFESQFGASDWIIYQNTETNKMYIRLKSEFMDGRFEQTTV